MVRQALNTVCDTIAGCEMLAYADLSTQIVLATNDGSDHTRDTLNDLCAEAKLLLEQGDIGIVGTAEGFRLFLKDAAEPADGLICLCARKTDIAELLPAARRCLAQIAAGEPGE